MTIEYILLFSLMAFLMMGAFIGEKGPMKVFENSAPKLGARVEQQLSTGSEFRGLQSAWQVPPGPAPSGKPE